MKLTLLTCLIATATVINAQNFEWAKSFGGITSEFGRSIGVDASGNVYIGGSFTGTVDFDPGAGATILTSAGGDDIFIQKLDAKGNFIWAKRAGGTSNDWCQSISVDDSGTLYATGYFYGTVDFDPGAGTANLTSVGNEDIFVQKIDASGNLIWARSFGGTNYEEGFSITEDASKNVYTTGYFYGTVDFDPGAATSYLSSAGSSDIFVQKMDASGNFIWAKRMGGTFGDYARSTCVDALGNLYTTGYFWGTSDFDPGTGTANLTSLTETNSLTQYNEDIFVQKMDASGTFIWAKRFGGNSWDRGHSIVADAMGNVYTTGYFKKTADFDPGTNTFNITEVGNQDVFVQKMDASGNFIWAKSMGGPNLQHGNSISTDASGNVYTMGYFSGTVDFDPGSGTTYLKHIGSDDIFVQKLDASGSFLWAKNFGGYYHDFGASMCLDDSGNVYTTGWFEGTADYDTEAGTIKLISEGLYDVVVQKIGQTTITGLDELSYNIKPTVFPNPSIGDVHISFNQTLSEAEIILTDLTGKVISKQTYSSVNTTMFELPETKGIYFLTIKTSKGQHAIKLAKE